MYDYLSHFIYTILLKSVSFTISIFFGIRQKCYKNVNDEYCFQNDIFCDVIRTDEYRHIRHFKATLKGSKQLLIIIMIIKILLLIIITTIIIIVIIIVARRVLSIK